MTGKKDRPTRMWMSYSDGRPVESWEIKPPEESTLSQLREKCLKAANCFRLAKVFIQESPKS